MATVDLTGWTGRHRPWGKLKILGYVNTSMVLCSFEDGERRPVSLKDLVCLEPPSSTEEVS